ncbi:MAG: hypothetical protein RLZZ140_308 [Pseudomonadota bacterium]
MSPKLWAMSEFEPSSRFGLLRQLTVAVIWISAVSVIGQNLTETAPLEAPRLGLRPDLDIRLCFDCDCRGVGLAQDAPPCPAGSDRGLVCDQ